MEWCCRTIDRRYSNVPTSQSLHFLEERIMLLFLGHGRQRSVARANQRFRRQREDLFPHLLPGNVPGLIAAANGPGENRVPDNGYVRRIFRPRADDVRYAVLGMAGR